jgi:hypothetical protein
LRSAILVAGLVAAFPAFGGEMKAEEARHFVVGRMFTFTCFEGTKGAGRVHADGSVSGSIQFRGAGPVRFATLPAGTLRVNGERVCASLKGLPFEPCFNLEKTDNRSFRGSVSGIGFAYCDFTRQGRIEIANAATPPMALRLRSAEPGNSGGN